MTDLFRIDGNTLEGVSATTLRALAFDAAAHDYLTAHQNDRVGFMRRIRPGITLLEFAS
jgi:hypothetical protein